MAFEDDIRAALRREQPPADFAARVLARTARPRQSGQVVVLPVWRRPAVWAVAAGMTVAALLPPAILEYRHRQEERALAARAQLFFALKITRAKLQHAKERVHNATTRHAI